MIKKGFVNTVGEVPGQGTGKDGSLWEKAPEQRKASAQAFIYKGEV